MPTYSDRSSLDLTKCIAFRITPSKLLVYSRPGVFEGHVMGKVQAQSRSRKEGNPTFFAVARPFEHRTDMFCLDVMLILDNFILVMGHGLMAWVKDARQVRAGCDRHQIVDVLLSG